MKVQTILFFLVAAPVLGYEPTWESLDTRPLPQWYSDAKIGIFIHWGVFSVPSFGSEWFWYNWRKGHAKHHQQEYVDFVDKTEKPGFAYADYAHRFDAVFYDPDDWALTFARSGAQYVVLTGKHHEGFCNWDSRQIGTTWNWNSMEIGPRRDLVGELATAIRKPQIKSPQTNKALKFGIYHSLMEWFNPLYLKDLTKNMTSQVFPALKTIPELFNLVEAYEPEIVWSDGDWDAHSDYWNSKEFLAWLATNSSVKNTVVWNDRWGKDTRCKHGSFFNCHDHFLPKNTMQHKWENCITIDKGSWGWNRKSKLSDYRTTKELIDELVITVSRNGNMLINVGPASDGTISPIFVDRLFGLGDWLNVNGQAIYGTRSWKVCDQDSSNQNVYYTRDDTLLYAHMTSWPHDDQVFLSCPQVSNSTKVFMLGTEISRSESNSENKSVKDSRTDSHLLRIGKHKGRGDMAVIQLPNINPSTAPCEHVWVIAMTDIENIDGAN